MLLEKDKTIENLEEEVKELRFSLKRALDKANKVIDFERNDREQVQILELSKKVIFFHIFFNFLFF